MNSRQRRKLKRFSERMFKTLDLSGIGGVVRVGCWCNGLGTKDDPSEDDGKKYCGCAVGEAAFLAACRARRYWKNTLPPLIDVKDWDVTVEVVK